MALQAEDGGLSQPGRRTLALPATTAPVRIEVKNLIVVVLYHLAALLAFLPWFFSWTGVATFIAGIYIFGVLGINLCYHRLLTHRSFACPKWFEHLLVVLAVCCVQDPPARWVATHRLHHHHADEQPDPHSPLVSFFWGHMGWILVKNHGLSPLALYERYAADIIRDPFYIWLEQGNVWFRIVLLSWLAFFGIGTLGALAFGSTLAEALQFGASILIWGVFVRTVCVWHQTWAVNSIAHFWGYRNYETEDDSRNNVFVGIVSHGEGWHNNHHADPRSARHGHRRFEIDFTYLIIRGLAAIGLAKNIVKPRKSW
ncbi:MAG: fatty acid desaturase [Alphaproteobacteria bacterium]|jgi:stearoyl-CoA desaturase (delta-9 desaturase)